MLERYSQEPVSQGLGFRVMSKSSNSNRDANRGRNRDGNSNSNSNKDRNYGNKNNSGSSKNTFRSLGVFSGFRVSGSLTDMFVDPQPRGPRPTQVLNPETVRRETGKPQAPAT